MSSFPLDSEMVASFGIHSNLIVKRSDSAEIGRSVMLECMDIQRMGEMR